MFIKILLLLILTTSKIFAAASFSSLAIKKNADSDSLYKAVNLSAKSGTKDSPHLAYIPFDLPSGAVSAYSYLGDTIGYLPKGTEVKFRLTFTTNSTSYIQIAVNEKNAGDQYVIVTGSSSQISSGSTSTLDFTIDELCARYDSSDCDGIKDSLATAGSSVNLNIAVLASSTLRTAGTAISDIDDEISEGQIVMFKFKSVVETSAPTISNIAIGDENLTVNFTSPTYTNLGTVSKSIILTLTSTTSSTTLSSYGGILDTTRQTGVTSTGIDSSNAISSGELKLQKLVNNHNYNVAVGLINEYQLSTKISSSVAATPMDIEAFLQAQKCYLISAGFGEEHFVLDYFREIRDDILMKNTLGSKFVHFYYDSAPHYARIIYKSNVLRFLVRVFSYVAYYLMNYFYFFLLFLLLLVFVIQSPIKRFIGNNKHTI